MEGRLARRAVVRADELEEALEEPRLEERQRVLPELHKHVRQHRAGGSRRKSWTRRTLKTAARKNGPPKALTSAPARLGRFSLSLCFFCLPSAGATAYDAS